MKPARLGFCFTVGKMDRRFAGWVFVLVLVITLGLLAACSGEIATPMAKLSSGEELTNAAQETPIILTSTPRPTLEPGPVSDAVSAVASETNLDQVTFLGLTGEDWINIFISAVAFLLGYLFASWMVRVFLRWLVRRTPTDFDDAFLERIDGPVRFFVLVLFAQISIERLTFWGEDALRLLNNLFFMLYLSILFWIFWRLIGFSIEWYRAHREIKTEDQADRIDKTLPLIARVLYVTLITFTLIALLGHFSVNVTALLAAIGIIGLALSLAAQDTLNDIINGVLIWLDRPFRIGDRIEIQGEGTWGDVIDIGTRSTRILARDNSMVVVPNSVIGKSQVINYSYPDANVRLEVDFNLDYDEDLDKVRRIVIEVVRGVEHVLADQPVEALFRDFGESTIVFRVRWWIDSYVDTFLMFDQVNDAILNALRAADIKVAVPRQDLKVRADA